MARRTRRSETGSALMELALVVPLLMLTLVGTFDMGRFFFDTIEVNNAACAGAEYGARISSNSTDQSGMQQAALNDAANVPSMTAVADRRVCTDSSGSPTNCQTCASGSCAQPAPISIFVDVRTQATIRMLIPWPGLTNSSLTLRGKATMRAQ